MEKYGPEQVARTIDQTLLKPTATKSDVTRLCEEARTYRFACAVVAPAYVSLAHELLRGSEVKVCTVVGFPLGATTSRSKAFEARDALESGASELDMVINIGALKARDYDYVRRDIQAVVEEAAKFHNAIVKAIIETCLLSDDEKVKASILAREAGASYVKTSTGFAEGGATVSDVKLIRDAVGDAVGVKAAGGIRTLEDAVAMIEAGATRIGTSSGVEIMKAFKQ